MEPARSVEQVFFPLDEELGLLPGSLTPKQQENVTHLASWMPFDKAASLLERLVGVQVSEGTVRRYTYRTGQMVQEEEDERSQSETQGNRVLEKVPAQMVLSADGAFVPLVGGLWAEARTLAIATVVQRANKTHSTDLSYFSRMTEATTFTSLCTGEMERRHLFEAKAVAGVMDEAEWLQGMLDGHRPDAVRILDFPHAAQRVSAIIEAAQQAGRPLPSDAQERSLHLLKYRGPKPLLRWLRSVTRTLDPASKAQSNFCSASHEGQHGSIFTLAPFAKNPSKYFFVVCVQRNCSGSRTAPSGYAIKTSAHHRYQLVWVAQRNFPRSLAFGR